MRREESKLKKKLYTALILLVLGSSIIGFTFSSVLFTSGDGLFGSGQKIKRGELELIPTETGLAATIDGQAFEFAYLPEDVADVDSAGLVGAITASRMVYLTSDANSSFAVQISGTEFDMARLLDSRHNTFAEVAFTGQNNFGKQAISCKDATEFIPVVYFNFTNSTTEVAEGGSCFTVNFGSESGLQRIKDSLVYGLLGVE